MQRVQDNASTAQTHTDWQPAANIPRLRHDEATALAQAELHKFVDLLETLEGDDWHQPTACTLWNVKEIVAHQAGAYQQYSSFKNFVGLRAKEYTQPYLDKGMGVLDATNQAQVDRRADMTPVELIAELRQRIPETVAFRDALPGILRAVPFWDKDMRGWATLGYLTDTILTRDTWSHRLDICRATGREFQQTAAHDGRMTALVVRDLAHVLKSVLGGASVVYELTGAAGGSYLIGGADTPAAVITMDVLDFHLLASDRATADEIRAQNRVSFSGDEALAHKALDNTSVLY